MYIREYMNTSVITTTLDISIHDAQKLMEDHDIRRLPVVEDGKLIGLITRDKIREATAAPAISPPMWQLHYLSARMRVGDIMERNVITVGPNTTVEDAVVLAQEHRIGTLPVVVGDNHLIGIVTTTDLYKIATQFLGFGAGGCRIHIYEVSKTGRPFGEVLDIVNRHGLRIMSMFHIKPPGVGRQDCIIHVDADDDSEVVAELNAKGYDAEARPTGTARNHRTIVGPSRLAMTRPPGSGSLASHAPAMPQ